MTERLIFVRHGETDWNVEGRMQGGQDTPLNGRGRDQATAVGRSLKLEIRDQLGDLPWFVSPLLRTRVTADLARAAAGLPAGGCVFDDRLKELTFGTWEGLTWADVKKQAPDAFAGRVDAPWDAVPPGGESYAHAADRVRSWLDSRKGDAVIVSHGGIARVFMVLLAGLETARATHVDIWQGRFIIFEKGGFHWV